MDGNIWVHWANSLAAIAQNGLLFSKDVFDIERYKSVQKLAGEIIVNSTGLNINHVYDIFNSEKGYATPKLDVRGAIFKDSKILLVRERSDNKWTLPGGWADVNESPSEAVIREIHEETGLEACVTKLAALYDKHKHKHPPQLPHAYKAIFICEAVKGSFKTSIETSEIEYFEINSLPPLSLHRILPSQIERAYEHKLNSSLPTDFD